MRQPKRQNANTLDVWSLFEAAASAAPDRIAVDFRSQSISYRELRARAVAIRELLGARGVKHLDRVATLLPNTPLTVALYLALAALGSTVVPVNTRLAAREVEELLSEARPGLFIFDHQYQDKVARVGATVRTLLASELSLEVERVQLQPERSPPQYARIDPSDPCIIFYTSGTTGRPKGVIRTQQNVCLSVLIMMRMQNFRHDTVLLAPLPLFHISGWETKFLCCLLAGGRAVLMERFDAEEMLALVERHQVSHLFLVPTMTHDVLRLGKLTGRDLSSLRYWQSGTAPLPSELREEVVRQLPQLQFLISYGTTEAGTIAFLEHSERNCGPGCVGHILPSVHVRIVDDDGCDARAGEAGEIWCASPMVSAGLFAGEGKMATPATNDEGWLATGDLGYLDTDGFLFVSGRKKDVIISGGENVVAAEVEEALKSHPKISEAAVIGTPDDRWGEDVTAFIVPVSGATVARDEVDQHCRALLAGYKCPRRIEFVDSLPKTSIGKIAKAALRELAAQSGTAS